MFLDISHQEFDRQDRYHKRYQYTYDQDDQLCRAEGKTEFHKLQKTCAKHNRNCQEKGKLSRNSTGSSGEDSSDNSRSGAGSSRDYGKHLETANDQRRFKGKILQAGTDWSATFIVILDHNKQNTIYDQCDRNYNIIIKFLFNDIIKWKCDDDRRQTCYQDLDTAGCLRSAICVFFGIFLM